MFEKVYDCITNGDSCLCAQNEITSVRSMGLAFVFSCFLETSGLRNEHSLECVSLANKICM